MDNLKRILLVADDPSESAGLKGIFSELPPEWKVIFINKPEEALTQLEQVEFEAVFADLAAGPAASTEFLQEVWKKQPKPVRFLLGTGVDQQTIVTCVLGANQYLEKPLDLPKLQAALERAQAIDRLVRNKKIQTLVSRMRTFPSRPSLYLEVMRELRSSNASPKSVGELVAKDLAITTKLLQVVNSAYYGMAQHVSDPADAVLLLGLETTGALVLSIEAFARFDKVKPIYFSVEKVWKHSQSVAQTARRIAEAVTGDAAVAKDAYTAGLLHDIGKLTLALNFEEQYQGALNLAIKQKLPPCDVETEVFGASHAEIGAYLLALWALPFPIVEAVAAHHNPAKSLDPKFSALTALHLAERLENEQNAPDGTPEARTDYDYPEGLGLQPYIEQFRELAKNSEPDTDSTQFISRKKIPPLKAPAANAAAVEEQATNATTTDAPSAAKKPPLRKPFSIPQLENQPAPGWRGLSPALRMGIGAAAAVVILATLGYVLVSSLLGQANARTAPERQMARVAQPANEVPLTRVKLEEPPVIVPAPAPLKLQAIMYNGIHSTAIINGRTVRLGEPIEDGRILTITPAEVTVDRPGGKESLRLR